MGLAEPSCVKERTTLRNIWGAGSIRISPSLSFFKEKNQVNQLHEQSTIIRSSIVVDDSSLPLKNNFHLHSAFPIRLRLSYSYLGTLVSIFYVVAASSLRGQVSSI